MAKQISNRTEAGYDTVADDYFQNIFDELKDKPLDRELLDRFVDQTHDVGVVADIGCGPGHVVRYLNERGADVCGIDLSARMIEIAKTANPGVEFHQGDMTALDAADGTWAGVVAFYSILHIPRERLVETFREFKRVLQPGGVVLLAFHLGDQPMHKDEWWGHEVSLDFDFYHSGQIVEYLETAGLKVVDVIEREPYAPEIEYQSRRCYVFASQPDMEESV